MNDDKNNPDPGVIVELIMAFRRSKIMFAAISLGVFDALSHGPKDAAGLAEKMGADPGALGQLLDACVGLGLVTKKGADYANTPATSVYLCQDSPRRLTGYIKFSNDFLWKLWGNLEDAVRAGTHRWQQTFGWDGPIFANFFRTEEAKHEFLMGMHGFGLISSPQVVAAFDLGKFRQLVDLGGATGHLALAACQRYPGMQAIVFDLPEAAAMGQKMAIPVPGADRVRFVAGDFFKDPLPDADLYALGRILHDWTEEKILSLLKKVYESLPKGGAVLVLEKLLDEDRSGPISAQVQSLNMLVCTEGKERTLSEYEALLKSVGFTRVQGRRTPSAVDAILGFKE